MPVDDIQTRFGAGLPTIRQLGVTLFDPVWAMRQHPASGLELLHVIAGRVRLHLAGEVFAAGPGDSLIVPPGASHRDEFDLDEGFEVLFGSLDWPLAGAFCARVDNAALAAMAPNRKAEVAALFDQLRADLAASSPADLLVARARLHTILMLFLRATGQGANPADPAAAYGAERQRALMLAAKQYLADHYAQCITLDAIAAALNVSTCHLSHVFSAQSDFTLFGYLMDLRMRKARALLAAGRLNVSEVSQAVGYDNANSFSKAFKRYVGASPREFAARALRAAGESSAP